MLPPIAPRRSHVHEIHGDARPDDYHWLRERSDPEVLRYVEAENRYRDQVMAPLAGTADRIYAEMLSHIDEDRSEPAVQDGPYFYYRRTVKGLPYPLHARRRAASREEMPSAPEEIVLDPNREAAGEAFYGVTLLRMSPDHRLLAYLDNRDGSDRYTVRLRDVAADRLLDEAIEGVFLDGSLEWDALGEHLFYVALDETQRPCRLMRHRLGGGADELIYEEADPGYGLELSRSRSGRHLFLTSSSKETSEVRYLPSDEPRGAWRLFAPRRPGVMYALEDWQGDFLVLTNDGAENFQLLRQAQSDATAAPAPLLPYDPDVYLQFVHPFAEALVLEGRQGGLRQIWVLRDGRLRRVEWPEPLHVPRLWRNRMYRTDAALVSETSFLTPETIYELDLATLERKELQKERVPGYDSSLYRQERLWATAEDGARVPISLVWRQGARDDGPAPLVLAGYGAYGMPSEPAFDPKLLSLLDRGAVYAVAHVRGGGELGRAWYRDGKLLRKRNTFTDFLACAEHLCRAGVTSPERLGAMGRSAGGLLMGAVVNLRPDLFRVVAAGVPFVDVVSTMLDASIPLTSLEWEEWGDPRQREYYAYMKSYSPYDNVEPHAYPSLYVYTGLHDPRVAYWEPLKWVAKLRAVGTVRGDLVLKTLLGAGHGGSSGRYARLREYAEEQAFLLHNLGLT